MSTNEKRVNCGNGKPVGALCGDVCREMSLHGVCRNGTCLINALKEHDGAVEFRVNGQLYFAAAVHGGKRLKAHSIRVQSCG